MSTEQPTNSTVLSWLCRTYESHEKRKALARQFYLATVRRIDDTGNSDEARNELAAYLKSLFSEFQASDLTVARWNKEFIEIEMIEIPAPALDENVNWDYIADYFLLSAAVPWQKFDEINNSRHWWNQRYKDRLAANIDRLQQHSNFIKSFVNELPLPDSFDINKAVVRHRQEKFSIKDKNGNTKDETRRVKEQGQLFCLEPPVLIDEDEKMQILLPMLSFYQSKYFGMDKRKPQERSR